MAATYDDELKKYLNILNSNDDSLINTLDDPSIISKLVHMKDKLPLEKATYELTLSCFKFLLYNDPKDITAIRTLNQEYLMDIVSRLHQTIDFDKINASSVASIFSKLEGHEIISYLLTYDYFIDYFLALPFYTLDSYFSEHKIKMNPKLVKKLITFISTLEEKDEYLYILNDYEHILGDYDEYTTICEIVRKRYCKKIKNELKNNWDNLSTNRICVMIVKYYFDDTILSLTGDIEQILKFIEKTNTVIDSDLLKLYKRLIYITMKSKDDLKQLMEDLESQEGLIEKHYDIMRKLKDISYENITSNLLNTSIIKESESLSKIYETPIYILAGQNFNAIVNVTQYPREYFVPINWNRNGVIETISLSYINQDKIGMFDNPYRCVVLGFSNVNPDQIKHLCHEDSYTDGKFGTEYQNELHTKESLISETEQYNEILYVHKPITILPSYVLAIEKIQPGDVAAAQKLCIPIVFVPEYEYDFKKLKMQLSWSESYGTY